MANKIINTGDNNSSSDLKDSPQDLAKMKSEFTTIDLPDVKDIPGQENIVPLPLGELSDLTIASADEEGDNIFDDEDEIDEDEDSNVSISEKEDLENTTNDMPTEDDISLRSAGLDDKDDDGTPLNEGSFKKDISGSDLDIPGADEDDENEEIGEEDEENNDYSIGGEDHDDIIQDNI